MNRIFRFAEVVATLVAMLGFASTAHAADPLPSWNDAAAKQSIVKFVERVTREGSPDFVPAPERIATFDNDGTLWAEQPIYFQVLFMADRVKAMAPKHPEWKTKEPFASLLKGDMAGLTAGGEAGVAELIVATHSGMTTDEFSRLVSDWIATAKHPEDRPPAHRDGLPADARAARLPARQRLQDLHRLGRRHRVHAPLDGKGLRHPAGAGGRIERRPTSSRCRGGKPVLVKLPKLVLNDDKEGKPVGIQRHIGRRPIAAFGNSDGDLQMLQWTCIAEARASASTCTTRTRARVGLRPRLATSARSTRGSTRPRRRGWTVVSMKDDWKKVFAFE